MSTGAWVLVVAVVVAVGFGVLRRRTDGRFRAADRSSVEPGRSSVEPVETEALRDGRRATSSGSGETGATYSGSGEAGATSSGSGETGATTTGSGDVGATSSGETSSTKGEAAVGVLAGTPFAAELGERATLVQFSSAFCAPCRATRRVLGEVVEVVPGVAHVEVDAEQHLDLVRRLGVLRTPTTLVLDAAGREVTRAAGAPSRQQVMAALGAALP